MSVFAPSLLAFHQCHNVKQNSKLDDFFSSSSCTGLSHCTNIKKSCIQSIHLGRLKTSATFLATADISIFYNTNYTSVTNRRSHHHNIHKCFYDAELSSFLEVADDDE